MTDAAESVVGGEGRHDQQGACPLGEGPGQSDEDVPVQSQGPVQ